MEPESSRLLLHRWRLKRAVAALARGLAYIATRCSSPRRGGESSGEMKISIIRHEAILDCGTYEVRFPDGWPSQYFYWDNIPGRQLRPDLVDSSTAERDAGAFARAEQDKLASQSGTET